ncbi:MAG: hypothetical protein JJ977_15820 [Kordiimonadaceae bacterium]|nr:hypothetical protein [Kordiimonadaceae bacterium]
MDRAKVRGANSDKAASMANAQRPRSTNRNPWGKSIRGKMTARMKRRANRREARRREPLPEHPAYNRTRAGALADLFYNDVAGGLGRVAKWLFRR